MTTAPSPLIEAIVPVIRKAALRGARRRGLSDDECEDVVQDVLLAFWEHDYAKIDTTKNVGGFVWTRVRWSVADVIRRRSNHYRRHDYIEEALHERIPSADEMLEEDDRRNLQRAAAEALRELAEPERTAVVAGLEYRGLVDLAKARGVSASQPTRWRTAGLKRLRRELGLVARRAA